jgi:DNA mismatch endonuclease (patch repair protein)
MARVRSRDTQPELLVRRLLSGQGVRYRLHRKDLPGRPDIYLGRLRLAVFVNGCFWHGHKCRRGRRPKSNVEFWNEKINRNIARDRRTVKDLRTHDVSPLILWLCRADDFPRVCKDIARRYRRAPQ